MLEINEIKKELLKSRATANFSHYTAGNLYYTVMINGELYQFPIPTIEVDTDATARLGRELLFLSSDLGTTSFYSGMRASELNRWIAKAVENNEFVKVS